MGETFHKNLQSSGEQGQYSNSCKERYNFAEMRKEAFQFF